ncbi:MAG: ABC transporter ATP-binding protein [Burkholderiaceae bacterium]|nr:MAG: ABC transporter ATP-binding protein [Burkholderiaceae bacterium]MBE7426833.1 ABC transporter ATP-binding protein [Ideonella sp.]MCC7286391.1 ABC transporter ATP-binding protein [Burkholderiaceae bacterium]
MLELDAIHTFYGRSHILQGVSLEVRRGEMVTLLGRNGVGKTTTLRSIMGLTPAREGRVRFDGRDITRAKTHRIARAGLAYVPSGRRIFSALTVRQNLLLCVRGAVGGNSAWTVERVYRMFPKLAELDSRKAGLLSGGEQQMLKLGRALVANPRLLLLDELTEGLAPTIVGDLADWLGLLKAEGFSMLMCEQNALFALELADRGYIMEKGQIRFSGAAAELRGSAQIRQYLGV